jgi:hypothetical protein
MLPPSIFGDIKRLGPWDNNYSITISHHYITGIHQNTTNIDGVHHI